MHTIATLAAEFGTDADSLATFMGLVLSEGYDVDAELDLETETYIREAWSQGLAAAE